MEVQFVLFLSEMGFLDEVSTLSNNIFKFMCTIFLSIIIIFMKCLTVVTFCSFYFVKTCWAAKNRLSGQLHIHGGYQMRQ